MSTLTRKFQHIVIGFLLTIISIGMYAQNPIVPSGVYIADPSARVWKDGKLYVYGSRDENKNYYCSWTHHVLSSSDLKNWSLTENAFASKGPGDQVAYSDYLLYAPDCMYRNDTFYLYYCLATNEKTEGVATSSSPLGPFVNGRPISPGKINEIDPGIFIDDDGQAYYLWGQITAKMARMKDNMMEIDESTVRDSVLTEGEHFFHEGGYLVKRNGIYYFIYAHIGRANRPTCIGYATSRSPMGPYKYGGVIVDNDHSDPSVWNNHGSIVEFKGQWYVFYHRSTHNSVTMRKACVEPITFNEDGSINEVEMTTQGASGPLSVFARMEAERACLLFGNVFIQAYDKNQEELAVMQNEDKAAYKYFDFGQGADSITFRIKSAKDGVRIDVAVDHSWGPSIGFADLSPSKGQEEWQELTIPVKKITGVHAVWLRFYSKNPEGMKVDWFQFK